MRRLINFLFLIILLSISAVLWITICDASWKHILGGTHASITARARSDRSLSEVSANNIIFVGFSGCCLRGYAICSTAKIIGKNKFNRYFHKKKTVTDNRKKKKRNFAETPSKRSSAPGGDLAKLRS